MGQLETPAQGDINLGKKTHIIDIRDAESRKKNRGSVQRRGEHKRSTQRYKIAELRNRKNQAQDKPHMIFVTEVKPKNARYQTTEAEKNTFLARR